MAVKRNRQGVQFLSLDSDDVVRQPVEEVILERVQRLLRERPEIKQYEFGAAIGRGYSWVSAFLKGKRPVTDVALLCRIARFFPVSAAYLLGEGGSDDDPKTPVIHELWRLMDEQQRRMLLSVAKTFALSADTDGDATPPSGSGARDAAPHHKRQTRAEGPEPHRRKHR